MKLGYQCKGNAITEFSVLALVLVPAFLAMPILGKVGNVNQTSVQASRYAVWERTVSGPDEKSDAQLHTEVSNRFFARPDLPIESNQGVISGADSVNHFWSGFRKEDNTKVGLVDDPASDVYLSLSNQSMPSSIGADVFSEALVSIGNAMDSLVPDAEWGLEQKGLIGSDVGVAVQTNHRLPKGTDCSNNSSTTVFACARNRNVMFVDAWEAGSPGQVEERVRALVPAGVLSPVTDSVAHVGAIPIFKELKDLKGVMGEVRPDVLPLDRYGDL